jgi:tetratricopeptide (TPR) repeat protein
VNRKERRALGKTAPDRHPEAVQGAYTLYMQGNLTAAETRLRQVLAEAPGQPEAMRLLGELLTDRGQFDASIALLRRLIGTQPRNFQAHYAIGNAYRLSGQLELAIAAYRASIALEARFAGTHHGIAAALRSAGQERQALQHYREAARLQPDWAIGWRDLGLNLALLGDLAGAEAALERAVALQPGLGDAQRHLAAIRQKPASQQEIADLTARARDPRLAPAERVEMLFALGRMAEKAQDFGTAFGHFEAANKLLREQLQNAGRAFNPARLKADIDRIITKFSVGAFEPYTGFGNASEAPVFIVGMPRAGSSLFEQIAASHSEVFGAGERQDIGGISNRIGWAPSPAWSQEAIATSAAEYLAALPVAPGITRVIDKMPDNIFQLGLIAVLFPKARVIFCERDPRDLALSCYFQRFAQPYGFDTDLRDIALRIQELGRLRSHWLQVLPLRCMTFSYEGLLKDPATQAKRLIQFLGLNWEEKCLAFHETDRVVRTASWAQVRKPLYQDSLDRWKNYASHLGPLFDVLPGDDRTAQGPE